MFVLWMGGIADGVKVFGVARSTAYVFRRTTTGGLEQEGKSFCRRVVEPFFEFDHVVPTVAEVIKIMDCLGAGLSNDIAEPGLAGIDGRGPKFTVGIRNAPTFLASVELEEVAVCPTKRRLKRQMQPIKAQGDR